MFHRVLSTVLWRARQTSDVFQRRKLRQTVKRRWRLWISEVVVQHWVTSGFVLFTNDCKLKRLSDALPWSRRLFACWLNGRESDFLLFFASIADHRDQPLSFSRRVSCMFRFVVSINYLLNKFLVFTENIPSLLGWKFWSLLNSRWRARSINFKTFILWAMEYIR